MNKRISKKKFENACDSYTNKKQRDANKALCKRYPFLIPRNVWTDKISWINKPYDWTLVEFFPKGWWQAFGIQMCEEIREDCIKHNYLYQLRLEEIKEKFAELRIYTGGIPVDSKVTDIIDDYTVLSRNICMHCGVPDIHMIRNGGWLIPICEDCFDRINRDKIRFGLIKITENYSDYICKDDTGRMADERRYTCYYPDGTREDCMVDLTAKAEKIRARWKAKEGGENS